MKLKKTIIILVFVICVFGLIYSIFNIVKWKLNVDENKNIKEKIKDKITVNNNTYNVDFNTLKNKNEDTIAYVKVNNTNIDYIVVKGSDNSYYLNHNFNKEYNVAGWIFGDYRNKFDETDKNLILYGHDTKDGSMFGTLKNVIDKNWYENPDNYKIVLVTEKNTYYYQIFSSYSIVSEEYYINTDFESDEAFSTFINNLKNRSIYNYGVEVNEKDKILTLSSCTGDGNKRVVVHAKLLTL